MIIVNCDLDTTATNGARLLQRILPRAAIVDAVVGETVPLDDDAYIITGSSAGVKERREWIGRVRDAIVALHKRGTPLLGICFGMQLLAEALGGKVVAGHTRQRGFRELAFARDELFEESPLHVYQHHEDSVVALPGASILAENEHGIQAYRLGTSVGLQFHPEVNGLAALQMAARDGIAGDAVLAGLPVSYDVPRHLVVRFNAARRPSRSAPT